MPSSSASGTKTHRTGGTRLKIIVGENSIAPGVPGISAKKRGKRNNYPVALVASRGAGVKHTTNKTSAAWRPQQLLL